MASLVGPLITVAIPTFNRGALLGGCIQAALSQTYDNIEVLVSDNASTDDTEAVLREFDDKRLRVLRQENNIGMHPNWNACLAAARGEYVVFVSDDDRISPWFLERCVGAIKQSQVPVVIALSDVRVFSSGQTKRARTSRHIGSGIRSGTDVLSEFLMNETTIAMCSVVLRTEALRSRGGFPLDFPHTADIAVWAPLLFEDQVGFVNETCATYNLHQNSETARLSVVEILHDGCKFTDLISGMADERIKHPSLREKIKLQARHFFSRQALIFLAYHHSNGAGLNEILTLVWRFRKDLMSVEKLSALRFVAIIICPRPIAARLRHLKQAFAEGWEGRRTAVKAG